MLLGSVLMVGTGCGRQPVSPDAGLSLRMEKLEQEQQRTTQTQQELERKNQDLQNRLFDLETRLSGLETGAVPVLGQGADPAPATQMVPASSGLGAVTAKTSTPPAPMAGDPEYDRALELFRSGQVVEGRNALQAYKDSHPNSPLMPNVLYWLGESKVDQKHYDQAILTFKQIPQNYPKHPKAPDALFKIVVCYMALGDRGNGGFYKGILLNQYPRSSAARLVKERFPQLLPIR
jgi:tol-pal system protein YbgF